MRPRSTSLTAVCLTVVATGLLFAGPALALDPLKAISQYVHDSWEIEDGLPQNSVSDIEQDAKGYLWLATHEGLVRFDGVRFVVYNKSNTDAMSSNEIRAFHLDGEDVLWIGTYGGGLLRLEEGSFTAFGKDEGLDDTRIWDVSGSESAGIWLATHRGLFRFRDGKFTSFTTEDGLAGDDVRCVLADEDGTVWAGTMNGLSRFSNGVFQRYTTADGLPHDKVKSLHRDGKGRLWVGTHTGVSMLEHGRFTSYGTADGLVHDSVIGIYGDTEGTMWFGTDGGLSRLHAGVFTSFTPDEGLTQGKVRSFYEDLEGSLWIGTETGGLNRLREGKFTAYTHRTGLPADLIWSFYERRDGRLLIGTGEGLVEKDGESFELFLRDPDASNNSIASLYESPDGTMWVGTRGDGLYVFEDGSFRDFPGRERLSQDYVHALEQDADGNLWIGTRDGLRRLRDGRVTAFTTRDGLAGDAVRAIAAHDNGDLWIGTGTGLSLYREGVFTNFTTADGLSSDAVFAIHRDEDGTLWFGTYGGGLNRYRDGVFHHVTSKDGLYDDVVYVILEDGSGNLWMTGNKGVFRVSKTDFYHVVTGHEDSLESPFYGTADGMKSRECNGGLQSAAFKTADGRMWFSTIRGAVVVDPDRLPVNPVPPPVYLEKLIVDGDELPATSTDLSPGAEKLEFHYTALSYAVPEKVHFRYMLEGYDREWVDAGTRRVAYYTNLSPGDYVFRVRASNNDGVWNDAGAELLFKKTPHFYETGRFAASVAALVILTLFAAYRRRIRRLRKRQNELEALVDLRTQELREASLRDSLTGLRNRRFVHEIVQPETAVFAERRQYLVANGGPRSAHPADSYMGVFLVDADHFKEVNDTLGHEAGDRILKQFAEVLQSTIRKDDVVVRWGGEEFLVVLRHTAYRFLGEYANRIRQTIAETDFAVSDDPKDAVRKTCSIGYAPFPFHAGVPDMFSFEQAVMLADLGLYRAKHTGRDRAVGVMPTERTPVPADVTQMVKSLDYATTAGLIRLQTEETPDEQDSRASA